MSKVFSDGVNYRKLWEAENKRRHDIMKSRYKHLSERKIKIMNEKINKSKDMQPILYAMLEVSKENMKNLIGDCLSNATLGVFAGKFFS